MILSKLQWFSLKPRNSNTTQQVANITCEIPYVNMPLKRRERSSYKCEGLCLLRASRKEGCGIGRNICFPGPSQTRFILTKRSRLIKFQQALCELSTGFFLSHRNIYVSISIYNIFFYSTLVRMQLWLLNVYFSDIPSPFEEIQGRKRKMLTSFQSHDLQERFLKSKWTISEFIIK